MPTDAELERLRSLIFAGQKIAAIKLYRELTGVGLKEAKQAVESLEATLRTNSPEKFSAAPRARPGGCLGTAAAFALAGLGATIWWMQG